MDGKEEDRRQKNDENMRNFDESYFRLENL